MSVSNFFFVTGNRRGVKFLAAHIILRDEYVIFYKQNAKRLNTRATRLNR